ncbi:MAG: hypothetical protein ABFD90_13265 [Phycisphaerales bacterium]
MMEQKRWWVLFWVASILLMFCVVRAIRSPAASDASQRIEVCEGRAQSDENEMDAPFEDMETMAANFRKAVDAERVVQLEAAKEVQL